MYKRRTQAISAFVIYVLAVGASGMLLSGCSGAMGNLGHIFDGEDNNREKLSKNVTQFHQALYWGDVDEAALFVAPEIRPDFIYQASLRKDEEKVVTTDVKRIVVDETGDQAMVDVFIKYYRIPRYEVNTRHERQTWEFNTQEARWLFKESSLVKQESSEATM